jgi:pyruvate/2-oxoglutarate dehydrogenase complex dihydrolipoamide dehydrogenase (E3) component
VSERFDIAIIGGGSAGLTGAVFAARLGARVALVERDRLGGDCTWTGCVPSKALIRAAHVAHDAAGAGRFGIDVAAPRTDMPRVREWIDGAVAAAYAHETPEVLERRGVTVLFGPARFVDAHTMTAGDRRFSAKRVIICTGAHAVIPDLAGLSDVPYLTYDRIFELAELPAHLLVIGAGPLGVEIAQAYRRLGAAVTLIGPTILRREEPEAREFVVSLLAGEGVRVLQERATSVRATAGGIEVDMAGTTIAGDRVLVAAGRAPNVGGLDLERAGVAYDARGIRVDRYLRTSARHIYACGDVIGRGQFTHLAGWQCFQAVRNALLPGRTAGIPEVLPTVTFTDPEVARVGLTEAEARTRHGNAVGVHRWPMSRTDRALCDGEDSGFIRLVTRRDREILGATIVAARAGEMIGEVALAMRKRLDLDAIAGTIHAYPTWSLALQQQASEVVTARFLSSRAGRFIRWLSRLRG